MQGTKRLGIEELINIFEVRALFLFPNLAFTSFSLSSPYSLSLSLTLSLSASVSLWAG